MTINKVPLVSVCDFQGGSQPPKSEWITEHRDGYIRMLQIRDFTQERKHEIEYVRKKDNLNTCEVDDILIARYGASIGKILTGLSGTYNVAIIKTIPNEQKIIKKYLYYYLNSIIFQSFIKNVGTRAAQAGFNKEDLKKLLIYLPSLKRQKQIVGVLDKVQELINKRNAQLKELDQLAISVFLDIFGDPLKTDKNLQVVPLKNLAEIIMGQSPKGDSYNTEGEGVPLLNGPTEFREIHPLEKQWTTDSKKLCRKDDILFCVRGATAGRMNFADKEYCIGRGIAAVRCYEKSNIPFIYQTLKFLYRNFQETSNGSTFINIDKKRLEGIPIPDIDKGQKDRYFNIIESVNLQKINLHKSLTLLEQTYNSLMQRSFKGELFND